MKEQEALWIEEARKGDDDAFGNLVNIYQKPLFSLCYRMLENSKDAEDAAQESFLRAHQNLKRYDPERSFATWLLSIASHHCIDRIRKKRVLTISTDAIPGEIIADRNAPEPEKEINETEQEALIQSLLLELRPTDRAAIILQYWHDYSEVQIAETLNLSVSAVKSRLYRSRQALANAWINAEQSQSIKERRRHESPAF